MNGNGLKRIGIIAGTIVALGGAAGVIVKYAPWAWAGDLKTVAVDSYKTAINQQFNLLLITQEHLRKARAADDRVAELELTQQELRIREEIERLKQQQQKFR